MKVWVEKETCIGCGVCPAIAPQYFKIDDDGKAATIDESGNPVPFREVPEADRDLVMNAVMSCPTSSIKTEE